MFLNVFLKIPARRARPMQEGKEGPRHVIGEWDGMGM